MKGLFIPEITAEMFRNGCLESIEALMAEGEIYDIEYSPTDSSTTNIGSSTDLSTTNIGSTTRRRMTNEEAITELSVLWERNGSPTDGRYREALDMAIEALEHINDLNKKGFVFISNEAYDDLCRKAKSSEERTQTHECDGSEHETHEERTDGDCISREAAFNAINEIKIRRNATWYELYRKVLEVIGGLPPFNPTKVGHWIEHEWAQELDGEGYLISNFECDKCHAWAGADYDYCPNCGVKMEVENDR